MSAEQLQNIISPKFTLQVLINIATKRTELSDVKVENIKIQNDPKKKGDAYVSQICRFAFTASGKNKKNEEEKVSIPVIVKFLPKNLARRKTFRCPVFFKNEEIFYTKVWPVLEKFQQSKNLNEFDNIPLLLSSWIDGHNDYLALLDLSPEGYEGASRGCDLGQNHTLLFLNVLASFHALSLACKDQQPELFEDAVLNLEETYYDEKYRSWYAPHQKNLFIVAADAVEKELPLCYVKKFKDFLKRDVFGGICEGARVRAPFSVVNHGDLWAPNFLIKQNFEKIVMIDFQLARYTTLSADLSFFLFTCIDIDLLEKNWDFLIAHYHDSLSKNLEKFGSSSSVVTLEALHDDLRNNMVFGVGVAIENVIMSLLDEEEVTDLDELEGDEAVPVTQVWKIRPFKDKGKRERLAKAIRFAIDRNFI